MKTHPDTLPSGVECEVVGQTPEPGCNEQQATAHAPMATHTSDEHWLIHSGCRCDVGHRGRNRVEGLSLEERPVGTDVLFLERNEVHNIGQLVLGPLLAGWVLRLHDLHLDAQHPLPQHNVANSNVQIVSAGLARGNHVAVLELHGLGTLSAELSGDYHLSALGALLHYKAQHAITRPTNSKPLQKLVSQGFCLSYGA